MSSSTWTPEELSSSAAQLKAEVWRSVEAQHRVSTMKLVDSLGEQRALEQIIETTKPPIPPECQHLHFLLYTPFRYGPYPKGSRFRRAGMSEGVFYATSCPETAVAEAAFYRLLFFAESPGLPFPKNPTEYTVYSVPIATPFAIDLTLPPFDVHTKKWMHPQNYAPCQAIEAIARRAGIEVICYASVRDLEHRHCYAVLRCSAFSATHPEKRQTWQLLASEFGVYAYCEAPKYGLTLALKSFLADTRLAPLKKGAA